MIFFAICGETCCITADLSSFFFYSLMEQLSNGVTSPVTTKLPAFKVARWWSKNVSDRDNTNDKNTRCSVIDMIMINNC